MTPDVRRTTQRNTRRMRQRVRQSDVRFRQSLGGRGMIGLVIGSMIGTVAGEFAKRRVFGD